MIPPSLPRVVIVLLYNLTNIVLRRIFFLLFSLPVVAQPVPLPHFKDISREAGLTVPHISTPDKQYIVESISGGVGLIDCDNDGKLDSIVANGSMTFALGPTPSSAAPRLPVIEP